MTKEMNISDLTPDDLNANLGTEYGSHLMDKSLTKFGAWRSIAADKNLKIAAGNKTLEHFAEIGMENIIVVPTDGTKLVVVQRVDIDSSTPEGGKKFREYALADNATGKANLAWDNNVLEKLEEDFGIDMNDWGVEITGFKEDEIPEPEKEKEEKICPHCGKVID